MSLFLVVIGAIAAALLEVMPYLSVGGVHPQPVLVFGIILVVATGLERGLVWAFVGGIVLDALAARPLGSTAFTLLLAFGAAAVLVKPLMRLRPLVPIVAVAVLSGAHSLVQLVVYSAIRTPILVADPINAVLPGVLFDIVLAVLFGPLIIAVRDRYVVKARLDW